MSESMTITDVLPSWTERCVLTRVGDTWHCDLTGDPRGIGTSSVTAATGATPADAIDHAADVAEGWRTFTLAPKGAAGDDGGEAR